MSFCNQASAKYLCGHPGTLTGSGRFGRIQEADRRFMRNNLCPDCNSVIQALIDTARTEPAMPINENGLQRPMARGTPRQVSWANAIIGEVFPLLSAVASAGLTRGDELGIAVARAIELISKIGDAGFWIKQQNAYRSMNSYCLSGDVADIIRKANHSYQGCGTSWLAGLVPCTSKPDKHYKFAQRDLLCHLMNEPSALDPVVKG